MHDSSVGILVFRCGAWVVGVDPLSVLSIRTPRADDRAVDLGAFLRGNGTASLAVAKARIIEVGGASAMAFKIDHTVGTKSFEVSEVLPLSPVLESYGAQRWWMGTTQLDGEQVLLLDLEALSAAIAEQT